MKRYDRVIGEALIRTWFSRVLAVLLCAAGVRAEDPARFEGEIRDYEMADRTKAPPRNAIVFAGSSSFRMWKDLQAAFPSRKVVNRGFGGSHMSDLRHFAARIVIPYRPKWVLVYEGDNDLAAGKSPGTVLADFQAFVREVHEKLPKTRIAFVSIKPSPSRRQFRPQQDQANELIRRFTATDRRLGFVNVVPTMVGPDGEPRAELFLDDRLHMNSQGYALWRNAIEGFLRHPRRTNPAD